MVLWIAFLRSMYLHDTCLSSGKSQGQSQGQSEKSCKSHNATECQKTESYIKRTKFVIKRGRGKLISLKGCGTALYILDQVIEG